MSGDKFPPNLLQEIKNRVNLLDVASEVIVLRKTGANHVGLCPFHSERSPSFSIHEGKQLYHCYGCKAGGDLFSFVQELQGLSFRDTVLELADRAGIKVPKEILQSGKGGGPQVHERVQTAYRLNRFAAKFYRENLEQNSDALEYVQRRGLTDATIKLFYLGYAHSDWDRLARHLSNAKAPLDLAKELGLLQPSKKAGAGPTDFFDLFRGRVIFPILDLKGKVAGFGGRLMSGEGPKYLNSPDSILFQKSKLLYGLFQARPYIRDRDEVILVEGYFDQLALFQAGFENTVATCGTALTADHLKLLKRFSERITLLFDGDEAGQDAMLRSMELGLTEGVLLRGVILPDRRDPDEWVRDGGEGLEKFKALVVGARPLLDIYTDQVIGGASGNEERTAAIKKLAHWLKLLKDPTAVKVRLQDAAQRLNVPAHWILELSGERGGGGSRTIPRGPAKPPARAENRFEVEAQVVAKWSVLFDRNPERLAKLFLELSDKIPRSVTISDIFEQDSARALASWLVGAVGTGTPLEKGLVVLESMGFSRENLRQVLSTIAEGSLGPSTQRDPLEEQPLLTIERGLVKAVWARFSHTVKEALAAAEAKKDNELQAKLMKDYLDVQRRMKELSYFYDENKES